ncbi:MAG: 3-methyl-2-oxobutanoate dehydrogenase subunit VorB [Candidatus Omnitrophica bacterium]|nr:3-methyl-2-oxobutanoate dehydrogenase subunit VorB [Candidatus Omnitrophota bacterium]
MNRKLQLMTGNEAIGEAAVCAGCKLYAGYPITPQNELTAYMSKRMTEEGRAFIQSESELAAISMVFGASVTGERSMTSSSSPGISLKQEGISYLAGCRLPSVIINIMRGGPGLGNIAPSQADYFQATRGGGHGDYRVIVLGPASVQEAFDLTVDSFNLADKYRMPAMVLADGLLGQMMEPVSVTRYPLPKAKKSWALTGAKNRKPNVIKSLFLRPGALEEYNIELQKTYDEIKKKEVRFEALYCDDAEIIIVAYGTTSRIARAAVKNLRKKKKRVGLLRPITLWPFPEEAIAKYAKKTKGFLVAEQSMGQMVEDVKLAVAGSAKVRLYGRPGGGIPTDEEIEKEVLRLKI